MGLEGGRVRRSRRREGAKALIFGQLQHWDEGRKEELHSNQTGRCQEALWGQDDSPHFAQSTRKEVATVALESLSGGAAHFCF